MDESFPRFALRAYQITPRAYQVVTYARQEAERLHHHFVGTEHLLLGLIRVGQGVASGVLQRQGLDLESLRQQVEKEAHPGDETPISDDMPFTPRVQRVFLLAKQEAEALQHTYIGTEHILLGLLREEEDVGGKVLKKLGADPKLCRLEILKELDPNCRPNQHEMSAALRESGGPFEKNPTWSIRGNRNEPPPHFTPRAQQVLALAREEANRLRHNFVGTEHVLLGLIRLGQGAAVAVLRQRLGLDLGQLRQLVEQEIHHGATPLVGEKIPYTPRTGKVLLHAAKEAKALQHRFVGTEHLLLGLVSESEGVAGKVLKAQGVALAPCRQEVLKELDPGFQPSRDETPPAS